VLAHPIMVGAGSARRPFLCAACADFMGYADLRGFIRFRLIPADGEKNDKTKHRPTSDDSRRAWVDTWGQLPHQPDALARVAASP
jgi:hypothetical protein